MHPLRQKAKNLLENRHVQRSILGLIIFNGLLLGLETSKTVMASPVGPILPILDSICLSVFVAELALAAFAYGSSFAKDPWRLFDAAVIAIALAPTGGGLSVLRGLRVLRVFRVINGAPSLKRIVTAMLAALPGMGSICALLGIIYYVAAVMTTKLFGEAFPEWFGDIGASVYTLFQVMTLESWSMGIVRPIMEKYPYAWAFFLPFIAIATFTMLNLFVGVVVGAMQAATAEHPDPDQKAEPTVADLERKLDAVLSQLETVRAQLVSDDRPRNAA